MGKDKKENNIMLTLSLLSLSIVKTFEKCPGNTPKQNNILELNQV